MFKRLLTTRSLCLSAIIAALYAALTLALPMLSYGTIQCRFAEAMTILPALFPQAIPGLTVGCLIANLMSPVGVPDIVFGTLATLLAAIASWMTRHSRAGRFPILSAVWPVLSNALIVGIMLSVCYQLPAILTILEVGAGELVAVAIGVLLFPLLDSNPQLKEFACV